MLTFEHELLAEFLVARYLARRFMERPEEVANTLGPRRDFGDTLMARFMVRSLPSLEGAIDILARTLRDAALPGRDFTVLLQMLLMVTPQSDVVRRSGISMEGRDLAQVHFIERDLSDLSFRAADLTDTIFDGCDLRSARFQGALLRGTRFVVSKKLQLESAQFGNLERFDHAYVGRQRHNDRLTFADWLTKAVGVRISPNEPCPSAQQLRLLLMKFVNPDGTGRRAEMSASIIPRGRKITDAPDPSSLLEELVRSGYILRVHHHDRIRRVPGDAYDDMVGFVKLWEVSARMMTVLDGVCERPGCEHVPPAGTSSSNP